MTATPRVMIVDDDAGFRFAMRKALARLGYDVVDASSGREALVHLTSDAPPAVALLDLRMEGISGIDVLRRRGNSPTRIIVLTGHGTVQAAVEAMKLGAFSFLEKPIDAPALAPLLAQAVEDSAQRAGVAGGGDFPPIVGNSPAIRELRSFVARVAPTDETVTIYGETGTGKEVVARNVHALSLRKVRPFIAFNGACVPKDLFESELFGHKRGAFTGATSDRLGMFREADGGTLFIDEVAELPLDAQAKLLRVLETRRVRAVGEQGETAVDVRIVAATNRELWGEVGAGRFREDLYFRLQVFPIVLPPLRQRGEDVVLLATHLLSRIGRGVVTLDDDAQSALLAYDWPGNVRELLNVLRRSVLFAENDRLDGALVRRMIAASVFAHVTPSDRPSAAPPVKPTESTTASGTTNLADIERAHIEQVLERTGGNITRAATMLGIDRRTLQRKLKVYGLTGVDG